MADEESKPRVTLKTLSDRAIVFNIEDGLRTVSELVCKLRIQEKLQPETAVRLVSKGSLVTDGNLPLTAGSTLYWMYYEDAAKALDPIESATGWDQKNRMRVFKAYFLISSRRFDEATPLLLDALTTFSEPDFVPFVDVACMAIICGLLSLGRPEMQRRLVRSPEINEIQADMEPCFKNMLLSFYNCRYSEFFVALADCQSVLCSHWLLGQHARVIVRDLRVRAYSQALRPYSSVTLTALAKAFGVSSKFVESDMAHFIAAKRLACVIDSVDCVVITSPPDSKNAEFEALLHDADALIASMDRLQRIVAST